MTPSAHRPILPSESAHPGQPIWGDLVIGEGRVTWFLKGEPEPLQRCLGLEQLPLGPKDPAHEALLRAQFAATFRTHNKLSIDGRVVLPELVTFTLPVDDPDEDGWLVVEAELVYPCDVPPRRVTLTWDNFEGTDYLGDSYVPVLVKHGREVQMFSLLPGEPEFTWHAPELRFEEPPAPPPTLPAQELHVPLASLALLLLAALLLALRWHARARRGVALSLGLLVLGALASWNVEALGLSWSRFTRPTQEQALALFESLHENIYTAFDAGTEDQIYDRLAASVAPELLEGLYADIYESLILRDQGGAVCAVDRIEADAGQVEFPAHSARRFEVDWSWRVHGLVSHYGHIHRRVNRYRARYGVQHDSRHDSQPDSRGWKITDVVVLEYERLE